MAYSFDILHSNGASACRLPDPADRFGAASLRPGDPCVIHAWLTFADYRALAQWMFDNHLASRVTLPNHRCEVCDSDGCFVGYHGHFFDDIGCFADWLEDNGEGERSVVQEPIEDGGWR